MKCFKLFFALMILTVIEENRNFLPNVIIYWMFVCQIGAFSSCLKIC